MSKENKENSFDDLEEREIAYIGQRFQSSDQQTKDFLQVKKIMELATRDVIDVIKSGPHNIGLRVNFRHAMGAAKDVACGAINLGVPEGQDVRTGKMITRSHDV